ncbi:MAG: divergent PAP2 family protein [Candidatus Omnitrophica bacterium]|nr:divergent PAP2 family protein [Candidatus Omnitrophota bacterium]
MSIIGSSRFDILLTTLIAWFIAQSIKVLLGVLREKRFDFKWFVGTGGMPSSHAAAVSALTTAVGLHTGFSSPSFCIALVFTIVVLFDAQGVRRSSGKQAEILNKILDDIYWKKKIQEERLRELIGHTPIEVFTGAFLGIFVALIFAA